MQAQMTSISTKGQAVIPISIRNQLGLSCGSKLMVLTDGENVLMKPIDSPCQESFEELVVKSRNLPDELAEESEKVVELVEITEDISTAMAKMNRAPMPPCT